MIWQDHRTRLLQTLQSQEFDFLIIGGGVTGAAVARDAATRGLKVALVEKSDFASGTSSRSSKLIHGGLRYLENWEFKLVFEALSERALLLKTTPHLVRPLPFYFPVYDTDPHGMNTMSVGLWLYDALSLFRSPGIHQRFSRDKLKKEIPFLKSDGLKGGFRYYDASMLDDRMVIELVRDGLKRGVAACNYLEAVAPLKTEGADGRITGFQVKDLQSDRKFNIHAKQTIVCAGPWTDLLGEKIAPSWKPQLAPSTGIHLIFSLKRMPVPGALVMSHPTDGRISFVIPRPELGPGIVIVGTTDGPAPEVPENQTITRNEVSYLFQLLDRYFPDLKLTRDDLLGSYMGIRPLVKPPEAVGGKLQKLSREHEIHRGPGRVTYVVGGKYTTHRVMAEEIVHFVLKKWRGESFRNQNIPFPKDLGRPQTKAPINPGAMPRTLKHAKADAEKQGLKVPEQLWNIYGADALEIAKQVKPQDKFVDSIEGFPLFEAQLRFALKNEMVFHLEDFLLRRTPFALCSPNTQTSLLVRLLEVWKEEGGKWVAENAEKEAERVLAVINRETQLAAKA